MAEEQILSEATGPATDEPGAFIVDEATDEALRLHLDAFEGPFDILLYLIKSQEIDIFDIPILKITEQYLRFLEVLREENLDVTGEFLVMAATLIQIKSKMLLPADADVEEDEEVEEEDPRLELVEKLIEYRRYRDITEKLQMLENARNEWFTRNAKVTIEPEPEDEEEDMLEVSIYDLIEAFRGVLRYITDDLQHTVQTEGASVDEKIEYIQTELADKGSLGWTELFRTCRSRVELVCCFLAILELCRMGRLRAQQHSAFDEIRLFLVEGEAA